MVYRYSWIAGIAALGLALWELSFLMRESNTGLPWPIAVLVATLLGAGITWTTIAYRAHAVVIVLANVIAFILTAGLLIAPDTLWLIFPTAGTWDAVLHELDRAMEIIRYGVEPVRPVPGLVMMLAGLFWILGFLLVAGLLNSRPFVAILTPLIVALQFVIIDRKPKGIGHLAVFVGIVALCLLAIRIDERDSGAGKLQRVNPTKRPTKRPSPAIGLLVLGTVAAALLVVGLAGDQVPNSGLVTWREPAGFSDSYSGSASYNPYTQIRAGLINQTNTPLFRARIDGDVPIDSVSFRTVTLDVYAGGRWGTFNRVQRTPLDENPFDAETQVYRGETVRVASDIEILGLKQPWMPAPVTPIAAFARDESDDSAIRVRGLDGTLILPGDVTYEGMVYSVLSEMPRYDGPTVAALTLAENGELSPLFQAAADAGEEIDLFGGAPPPLELENAEFWLEYPLDELGSAFTIYAEDVVGNVETNFEKALVLENFFRDSGQFVYNTGVPPGNATDNVMDWLTDETNAYARNGYCEQFATAMALMARAVGVPSRVVLGFTPGIPINDETVLVTDKNAHSWVELWIPSYGWMKFDPTPRSNFSDPTANERLIAALDFSPADFQDDIPAPSFADTEGGGEVFDDGRFDPTERSNPNVTPGAGGSDTTSSGFELPSWAPFAIFTSLIAAIAVVAAPLTQWWRRRRLRRRLERGDISAAWEDIVERLVDLKEPVSAASTPLEAATNIDEAFVPLAATYNRALYGEDDVDGAVTTQATQAHERAQQHLTTRYSRGERIRATYRPTRLSRHWNSLRNRFRKN
ncbi:MAG: transglutaminaseTgpA domain-containing protein [Acidimicrobiia bacterium]